MFIIFAYMKIETDRLRTVQNYATDIKRNRSRVYQMINEGKVNIIKIDGVIFIKP